MQFWTDSPQDDVSVTETMGRSSVEISTPRESVLRNPTACASAVMAKVGGGGDQRDIFPSPPVLALD